MRRREPVRCKDCGARLRFVHTPAGKKMPVEARPVYCLIDPRGSAWLVRGNGRLVRGEVLDKPVQEAEAAYVPHWAVCPAGPRYKAKREQAERTRKAQQEREAQQAKADTRRAEEEAAAQQLRLY